MPEVLIVDDDIDILMALKEVLECEGFNVQCVSNGAEALRLLWDAERLPALILLDMMMPVMDGVEFRKKQMSDPKISSIPVLMMSAGFRSTESHFLAKPIQINRLLSAIRQHVSL